MYDSGEGAAGGTSGIVIGSVGQALRAAEEALDFLNSAGAADLPGDACAEVLAALGRIQAKHAAARAEFLRRFDAASAHDADGYGSSAAWLAAQAGMSKKGAKAAVREMHRHQQRPVLADALRAGTVTQSLADEIAGWTKKMPADLRDEGDRVLVEAVAAGLPEEDLAVIAGHAIERWRGREPDPEEGDPFRDRFLDLATTLDGAGVVRGNLSPECAAALGAVLDALGKRQGKEDDRTAEQRAHDALHQACKLLLGAKLAPSRAGASTQAIVLIPLSQLRDLPGAAELEDAWIRARLGSDGYLTGDDAQAAACDAMIVPVVTGTPDTSVVDRIIAAVRAPAEELDGDLRYTIARLAIDLVSGPCGMASTLRTTLLDGALATRSRPLDIGWADTIPGHIRRAVQLRDKHCAWPKCTRKAVYCDVHHLRHKRIGGETSVDNCVLLCQFHHDVCIHRQGWTLTMHPDGSTEARNRNGTKIIRSHAPPGSSPGTAHFA